MKNQAICETAKLICADTSAMSADLLGFGEIHEQSETMHRLGQHLMPALVRCGFSVLAIEQWDRNKSWANRFNSGTCSDQDAAAIFLGGYLYRNQAEPLNSPKQVETSYFQMLLAAREAGLKLVTVDLTDVKPDDTPRDQHIAQGVRALLVGGQRVVYWGGVRHLAKRTATDTKFRTMAEIVSAANYPVYSIAQVSRLGSSYQNLDSVLPLLEVSPYLSTSSLGKDGNAVAISIETRGAKVCAPETFTALYKEWDALARLEPSEVEPTRQ